MSQIYKREKAHNTIVSSKTTIVKSKTVILGCPHLLGLVQLKTIEIKTTSDHLTEGPQDTKICNLGTTFTFFIRLSSNFAGWQNTVFQKILCFQVFDFNGFWPENDVTRLTAKLKFQDMAKQINFQKAGHCKIECKKMLSKTRLHFEDLPASITGTSSPTVISVDEIKCFLMLIDLLLALNMQICISQLFCA